MATLINDKEIRVLGCLIEKEMATPEYYPLSINALVNACNQKSNRTPVVSYDEATVILALDSLKDKKFVWQSDASRVTKYSQNFVKINNLIDKEAALICLLLLRGPQTLGELRGRSDRLYKFNNLEEVQNVLNSLRDMGIVMKLPKQPGRKEVRYIHLLAGEPDLEMGFQEEAASLTSSQTGDQSCITDLEKEIKSIREELNTLQQDFLDFKNQFE
jgi:uncharacterized protein YceH (UPF0502 family)